MQKTLRSLLCLALLSLVCLMPLGASAQSAGHRPQLTREEATRLAARLPGGGKTTLALPHALRLTAKASRPGYAAMPSRSLKAAGAAAGRTLWGNVIYSNTWPEGADAADTYGIYAFTATEAPTFTPLVVADNVDATYGGAIDGEGIFHACYVIEMFGYKMAYYSAYNTADWSSVGNPYKMLDDYSLLASTLAYDGVTGRIYGNFLTAEGDGQEFGYADYANFTHVALGKANTDLVTMAATPDGKLYGIDLEGTLYRISTADGTTTAVGSTGIVAGSYIQSATADPKTGLIYWATVSPSQQSALYRIDPQTAKAEKVTDFAGQEQIAFLHAPTEIEAGAPAQPADAKATFDKGSLSGTVTFTVPTLTHGGEPLNGTVSYTLVVGGQKLTGTAKPGQAVSLPITLEAGEAQFALTLSNEAGNGEAVKFTSWIGPDTPRPVTDVSLSVDEAHKTTLIWSAPTEGVHGGYVDSQTLTYDVVRQPDSVVVAQAQRNTTFSEQLNVSSYDVYYYEVTARQGDLAATPVASNKVALGSALTVPYAEDFSGNGFDKYTVIDANADGVSWRLSYGMAAYAYSDDNDADDWLLTPPIHLETGKIYELGYMLQGATFYTERYAVAYGEGSDPTAYATLVPPTDIAPAATASDLTQSLTVSRTGDYRFAFHALSPAGYMGLALDNISVTLAALATAPDSVTALTATAAPEGKRSVSLSAKAPTRTVAGQPLTTLKAVELRRGDELIHTFTAPEPGAALTYTDDAAAQGFNTYTLTPVNADGAGLKASIKVYAGLDVPGTPTGIILTDHADGTATLTWTAPTDLGPNGGYVDPAGLTYNVYSIGASGNLIPLEEGIKTTTYTVSDIPQTGAQGMVRYGVKAVNAIGDGTSGISSIILSGAAEQLPYRESFGGGTTSSYWSVGGSGTGRFAMTTDESADADGGSVAYTPQAAGELSTFSSGKVSIAGAINPHLTLSYYAQPGAALSLLINALPNGRTDSPVELAQIDYATLTGEAGWRELTYDLSALKAENSYVRLVFVGTGTATDTPIRLDNIALYDELEHNLAALPLNLPATVKAGTTLQLTAEVENQGLREAEAYEVVLKVNDTAVSRQTGKQTAAGAKAAYAFTYDVPITAPDTLRFATEVVYAPDLNQANNASAPAAVRVVAPTYPLVTGLAAEVKAEGVSLTWTEPTLTQGPVTEDFERYEAFTTTDLGEWTTIDGDGNPLYGFAGTSFPGQGGPAAFFVFNPSLVEGIDTDDRATPYSGKQFLASFSSSFGPSDDWLISPPLTGKAQTVSLQAAAWTTDYGAETFEILYSTTDNARESFTSAGTFTVNSANWKEYSAELPEGAKYFALHVTSDNTYMLKIDDIKYDKADYVLTGYRIYRDGEPLATLDGPPPAYTDATAPDGRHAYQVTALYTVGESALTEAVEVNLTGIEGVTAAGDLIIESLKGGLSVTAPAGTALTVYGADGRAVFTATATGHAQRIALTPGTYLVRGGHATVKAVVR